MRFFWAGILLPLVLAAAPSRGRMDSVLPPEVRVCGILEESEGALWLIHEERRPLALTGEEEILEALTRLARRWPEGLGMCVPHEDPEILGDADVLWVPWFAYVDPGASGVSVVSR